MIYIVISKDEAEEANKWVKENCDKVGGENTFTPDDEGNCIISLPDNGSPYVEAMKEHFDSQDIKTESGNYSMAMKANLNMSRLGIKGDLR